MFVSLQLIGASRSLRKQAPVQLASKRVLRFDDFDARNQYLNHILEQHLAQLEETQVTPRKRCFFNLFQLRIVLVSHAEHLFGFEYQNTNGDRHALNCTLQIPLPSLVLICADILLELILLIIYQSLPGLSLIRRSGLRVRRSCLRHVDTWDKELLRAVVYILLEMDQRLEVGYREKRFTQSGRVQDWLDLSH